MKDTRQNPPNQARIEKSLNKGKKELSLFIAYGDKASLYEDKFYKSLPSEKKSIVVELFKDMQQHERCIASNIVLHLNSRPFDYRTNATVANLTRHSTGRVNKLYAKLVGAGLLNKVKPHKFGACVYALAPSLRDMSFRRILGESIPVFKALCVGLLLSGIPKDSSCQIVMGRHINQEIYIYNSYISNNEEIEAPQGKKKHDNEKQCEFFMPGVRLDEMGLFGQELMRMSAAQIQRVKDLQREES